MDLRGRDFLKLLDYSSDEIRYLLDLAKDFKTKKEHRDLINFLKEKTLL